jgi:hypothetical protein
VKPRTIALELFVTHSSMLLAGDADIIVRHIRLVHISGVANGSGVLTDALDAWRVLVDETDRTGTSGQVKKLLEEGYTGPFSYEGTSPLIQNFGDPKTQIGASITYLRRLLDRPRARAAGPQRRSARLRRRRPAGQSLAQGVPLRRTGLRFADSGYRAERVS